MNYLEMEMPFFLVNHAGEPQSYWGEVEFLNLAFFERPADEQDAK